MFEKIYAGSVLYEIVYDREPFIAEHNVGEIEALGEGIYFPDKLVGVPYITEQNIGSTFFFSYQEAAERLKSITKEGEL